MLLQGFDEEDSDTVLRALNSPFIKHMDIEFARLARELPLPQPTTVAPKVTVRENAAPSYVSPNAPAQPAAAQVDVSWPFDIKMVCSKRPAALSTMTC